MTVEIEIIACEPLSDAFLKLNRYRLAVRAPDTGERVLVDRECVEGLRAAAVLPFVLRRGQRRRPAERRG